MKAFFIQIAKIIKRLHNKLLSIKYTRLSKIFMMLQALKLLDLERVVEEKRRVMSVKFFALIFLPQIIAFICDDAEIAASDRRRITQSYYIFGLVEIYKGSFDLEKFLRVFNFSDPSHGLPFILTPYHKVPNAQSQLGNCTDLFDQKFIKKVWQIPSNPVFNGILYGCGLRSRATEKIFILNGTTWTESALRQHCSNFPGVPGKFSSKQKTCVKDFQMYAMRCQRLKETTNIFNVEFFLVVVTLALVVTILILAKLYKIIGK